MRWGKPTEEKVISIARNLREADRIEVWLSHQSDPMEAVVGSWESSDICRCIEMDAGQPVGLTGLNGSRIWMLGTDELTATRRRRLQLCNEGREWVQHCLDVAGMPIGNDVYSKNTESIRWLKHLGFTVADPRPMGHAAALFSEFWRAA